MFKNKLKNYNNKSGTVKLNYKIFHNNWKGYSKSLQIKLHNKIYKS